MIKLSIFVQPQETHVIGSETSAMELKGNCIPFPLLNKSNVPKFPTIYVLATPLVLFRSVTLVFDWIHFKGKPVKWFFRIFSIPPGVGKSCLLLRFSDGSFTTSFITTIGIDFKIRTIELDGKRIKLQIWDTAGQERFRTITTAYYRGAMGILLVYDVTDESSFNNIRNWIRNIEQHASDNVNKILVGNKADMDESKRAVPTSKGQALADEYGIKFFETSAKTNLNVEEVFFSIARDIKQRVSETDSRAEPQTIKINQPDPTASGGQGAQKSACCGS
ncbi:hypothetical protein OIU74_021779 [Salix koriyanagi]|uniref:Uncharacterized protein n=1 Tax=Salix koriyanagi TaxID=2511006 RepID=A0A9Q0WIW9_9ROSI|nr:hypothetical protein OIU74_021779 [Salix koriyanagi]